METPRCIGIIMDGNRRFAREHNLALFEGHRAGSKKLKEVLRWAKEAGVSYVIVYAFSTENWNRSPEEVSYLLTLFKSILTNELEEMKREGVRIRCIGTLARFPLEIRESVVRAEAETRGLEGPTLVLALSYGGRAEIVEAANRAIEAGEHQMTEEKFSAHLSTAGIPDPDLIIRTSGEQRLSGFLPWQSVYSELFFTKTHWPALSREEFEGILKEFSRRERRMGE